MNIKIPTNNSNFSAELDERSDLICFLVKRLFTGLASLAGVPAPFILSSHFRRRPFCTDVQKRATNCNTYCGGSAASGGGVQLIKIMNRNNNRKKVAWFMYMFFYIL